MENTKTIKTVLAILAYFPFLWLIGLLIDPYNKDSFVRFHLGQGMILTIYGIIAGVLVAIVKFVLGLLLFLLPFGPAIANIIGDILGGIFFLIEAFMLIKGIINVVNEKEENMPLLGRFAFFK